MRLAMVATKAVQPDGQGVRPMLARFAVALVRPVVLFFTFVALLWRRGVFLLMAIVGGFLVGPWQRRPDGRAARDGVEGLLVQTRFRWTTFVIDRRCPAGGRDVACARLGPASWFDPPWFHRVSFVLVVLLLALALWRYRALRGRAHRQWYVATLVLGVAYLVADAVGLATGPLLVASGAAAIAGISTAWMAVRMRLVVVAGALVAYLGSAYLFHLAEGSGEPGRYAGWWSVVSLGLAATFIGILCTVTDVFPVRPVPTDVVPAARARADAAANRRAGAAPTP
jgi:hypothetical protein